MTTGEISRTGEAIFEKEILDKGLYEYTKIPSFSDNPDCWFLQKSGIDYLVDPDISIELKTRSRTYGNDILVETTQGNGPGFIQTAHASHLVYLWLDNRSVAVMALQSLREWFLGQDMGNFREVSASNYRGEVSRSRIIPFDAIKGMVGYKRDTLPMSDPGEFLTLN